MFRIDILFSSGLSVSFSSNAIFYLRENLLGRREGTVIRVFGEGGCENTKIQSISEVALTKTEIWKRFFFGSEET